MERYRVNDLGISFLTLLCVALFITVSAFAESGTDHHVRLPAGGGVSSVVLEGGHVRVQRGGQVFLESALDGPVDLILTGTPYEDDCFRVPVHEALRGRILVNGGAGGFDVLEIPSGRAAHVYCRFDNEHDGAVAYDYDNDRVSDLIIEYRGLEPIHDETNAVNVTLDFGSDSETITIENAGGGETRVNSDVGGETFTFNDPTGTLTINGGGGDDIIRLASLKDPYTASLIVNGESGNNTFDVDVDFDLGSNTLTANVNTITTDDGGIEISCGTCNFYGNHSTAGDLVINADALNTTGALSSTGAGLIALNCDALDLGGSCSSSGMLWILPKTPGTTVGVGGGSGDLNLDDTEIARIADGFFDIVIGSADAGGVDVLSATFTDPVSFMSGDAIHDGDSSPDEDVTAPTVSFHSDVEPGQSAGILDIDGNVLFAEGSWDFHVEFGGATAGTGSGHHDQLRVSGTVSLEMATAVSLTPSAVGGFVPSDGVSYTIIQCNGVTGTFDGLAEGAIVSTDFLGSGLPAAITYAGGDGNDVDIVVDSSLPVDLRELSARYENGGVAVAWTTETETDNLGFILEKSFDGAPWREIASYRSHDELACAGNSSQKHEYSFFDPDVSPGQSYVYRLSEVSTSGEVNIYDSISITLPDAPDETVLEKPFPNPFNPRTKISYRLGEAGPVDVSVYDLLGRKVTSLVSDRQNAGSYNVYWHGGDSAAGTYLIVLTTDAGVRAEKVVMVK